MVPDIKSLPDDIGMLKQSVLLYAVECEALRERIRLLTVQMYGSKSERFAVPDRDIDGQLLLFEPETPAPRKKGQDEPPLIIPPYERRKPGRKPLPAFLKRVDIVHDVSDAAKLCGCGATKCCIGAEVSEKLDVIPAILQVLRHIRPKYACKKCEGTNADGTPLAVTASPVASEPLAVPAADVVVPCAASTEPSTPGQAGRALVAAVTMPTIVIAPPPAQLIPKGLASPGLIAYVLTEKFVDGLPFYRQEAKFERMGIHLGRGTMCGWAIQVSEAMGRLMHLHRLDVLSGRSVQCDETEFQVLVELGRAAIAKSYLWAFLGGARKRSAVEFVYSPSRGETIPMVYLNGYKGHVQTDGYVGYNFLAEWPGCVHHSCMAHVRRKFIDVLKAAGARSGPGVAQEAIELIKGLYAIEDHGRSANLTEHELLAIRQEKSKPLMIELHNWLRAWSPAVPPKSLLGEAISYALGQWPRLERYLDCPYIDIDNNLIENAIRPFAVGRRNWLFAGTPAGATASARFYSLIESAKLNGIEPYWYLRTLCHYLPEAVSDDDLRQLLPQHIDKVLVTPATSPGLWVPPSVTARVA